MIESLHTGIKASITDVVATSEPFEVTNGVKQGCVLTLTLFSIFLSAMLEDAFRGLDDVSRDKMLTFSMLQTLRQKLKAVFCWSETFLLQMTVPCLPTQPKRILTAFSEASKRFGPKKTEVLYQLKPRQRNN